MAQFSHSERYNLTLVDSESGRSERVCVQVGMAGVELFDSSGRVSKRKYPLEHISRWALRGSNLILYTKTPVDIEERQVTLQGDESSVRSVLDTLTGACLQMCEILQSNQESGSREVVNDLRALVAGGGKKKGLPAADEVEYWHGADKEGWMHSQGEVMKLWRRRWFVLKQGYLFRFMNNDVGPSTKPRGIVDLSKITDCGSGKGVTGKDNSLKLSTARGHVCYVLDSATDTMEWMSAIEGAMAKAMKTIAGVDDEEASSALPSSELLKHLGGGGARSTTRQSSSNSASKPKNNIMVDVVDYRSQSNDIAGSNYLKGIAGARLASSSASSMASGGASNMYPSLASSVADAAPSYNTATFSRPYGSSQPTQAPQAPAMVTVNYGGAPAERSSSGGYGQAPYQAPSQGYGQPQQQSYAPQQQQYGGAGQQYGGAASQYSQTPSYSQQSSIMDQPLAQQPAYGAHAAYSVPQSQAAYGSAPQQQQQQQWQVLYTPEGRPYYHNSTTGITQWEAPAGLTA